jgi:hypothetical protein
MRHWVVRQAAVYPGHERSFFEIRWGRPRCNLDNMPAGNVEVVKDPDRDPWAVVRSYRPRISYRYIQIRTQNTECEAPTWCSSEVAKM